MKVVLFNGPPKCGKDTVARMLREVVEIKHTLPIKEESLSLPLRSIAYSMVGFKGELDGPDYEAFKLQRFAAYGDISGRQLMIDVSESFLKPTYGPTIMAELLLERNIGFDGLLLIRDSGFQIEVDPIVKAYGESNVYLVRVHRDGFDFTNDSREWVHLPKSQNQMSLPNYGDLADLKTEARRVYGRLLNQMAWRL